MAIDDKIRNEKLQYDINRESAKISALSSGKTGLARFTFSHVGNTLKNKQKAIKDQMK